MVNSSAINRFWFILISAILGLASLILFIYNTSVEGQSATASHNIGMLLVCTTMVLTTYAQILERKRLEAGKEA